MTRPDNLRHHGDEVLVYDAKGNYACRGKIVGVHRCDPAVYDVEPRDSRSLSERLHSIPESRLRSVWRPYLAYERRTLPKPVHVLDEV